MPLDGFNLLDWAVRNFAGSAAPVLAGCAIALFLAGLITAASGFRMVPVSWSLVASGLSIGVLAYFVVASAIDRGTELEGGGSVNSSAPTAVPWATAVAIAGYAFFALRLAWRSWASEEASAKLSAVLLVLGFSAGMFLAVQVVRGSTSPGAHRAQLIQNAQSAEPDGPIRHRGVTRPPRR